MAADLLARPGAAPARSTPVEDYPRTSVAPGAAVSNQASSTQKHFTGIKSATIGTTVYLLPSEHKRVKRLALDLDIPSVHELLLLGLDRLFADRADAPITRYSQPRGKK